MRIVNGPVGVNEGGLRRLVTVRVMAVFEAIDELGKDILNVEPVYRQVSVVELGLNIVQTDVAGRVMVVGNPMVM